jgi:hypothetical protein
VTQRGIDFFDRFFSRSDFAVPCELSALFIPAVDQLCCTWMITLFQLGNSPVLS